MIKEVDLQAFCNGLHSIEAGATLDAGEVNQYLLEHVLLPLLAGRNIYLSQIDYSQFETDELRILCGYYEETERLTDQLARLGEHFLSIPPLAAVKPAFF